MDPSSAGAIFDFLLPHFLRYFREVIIHWLMLSFFDILTGYHIQLLWKESANNVTHASFISVTLHILSSTLSIKNNASRMPKFNLKLEIVLE